MQISSRPRSNSFLSTSLTRFIAACVACCCLFAALLTLPLQAQSTATTQTTGNQIATNALTPLQREIERERLRLASSDVEQRRDAVMRLGTMKRADSSRAAVVALNDSSAIVRATATRAVLSLPPAEAVGVLIPTLRDRDEFVRQETSYALGETRNRAAVGALVAALKDKKDSVRGAAAVALGRIGDESAVVPLTEIFGRRVAASGVLNKIRRRKTNDNEFVRLSAARSLGQIGSRAAVPTLISLLADERLEDAVRREAVRSLGQLGDPSAINALRVALTSRDPSLSRLAYEALLKIAPTEATRPG